MTSEVFQEISYVVEFINLSQHAPLKRPTTWRNKAKESHLHDYLGVVCYNILWIRW